MPLTTAQKRDDMAQRMFLCTYSNDLEIYSELKERIMENSSCQNNKLEHLYFCKDLQVPINRPINTLVYCLYILLILIQTKFPPKMLALQLERVSYSVMVQLVETELNRVCGNGNAEVAKKKAKK